MCNFNEKDVPARWQPVCWVTDTKPKKLVVRVGPNAFQICGLDFALPLDHQGEPDETRYDWDQVIDLMQPEPTRKDFSEGRTFHADLGDVSSCGELRGKAGYWYGDYGAYIIKTEEGYSCTTHKEDSQIFETLEQAEDWFYNTLREVGWWS